MLKKALPPLSSAVHIIFSGTYVEKMCFKKGRRHCDAHNPLDLIVIKSVQHISNSEFSVFWSVKYKGRSRNRQAHTRNLTEL